MYIFTNTNTCIIVCIHIYSYNMYEKYQIDRRFLKRDYIRYNPSEVSTIDIPNSQIYINIAREDSVITLLNS